MKEKTQLEVNDLVRLVLRHCGKPLDIAVQPIKRSNGTATAEARATIAGQTAQYPFLHDPEQPIANLFTAYPHTVTINGREPKRSPVDEEEQPFLIESYNPHNDPLTNLNHPTFRPATGRSLGVRVKHLRFSYPEKWDDKQRIPNTRYFCLPDPDNQKPHYGYNLIFAVSPEYCLDEMDLPDATFYIQDGQPYILPGPGARRLLEEQAESCVIKALDIIREQFPAATIAQLPDKRTARGSHNGWAITPDHPLTPKHPAITVDFEPAAMCEALEYSLARIMYENPSLGLVPVRKDPQSQPHARLKLKAINVTDQEGKINVADEQDIEDTKFEHLPEGTVPAIDLHLEVNYPNGQTDRFTAPADLLILGHPQEASVLITPNYQGQPGALAEMMCAATIDQFPEHDDQPREHWEQCRFEATKLLQGANQAFRDELQDLADNFWPSGLPDQDTITVENGRHRLVWQRLK